MANIRQSVDLLNTSNENAFPNENIDPKIKGGDDFGRKVSRAIYYRSMYMDSVNLNRSRIKENRDYASGQQSIDQYKKILDPRIDNAKDKSWVNIDWSNSSPAQKYVNIIVGDMINQDYKIKFNSIDAKARTRKEAARDEYIGKMIRMADVIELEKQTGARLENIDDSSPKDMEELEMYMDMEFKESIEIAMEEIVEWEFYQNDLLKMRSRHCHDLVENNKAAIRWYWDENNNIRARYVDIYNLITSYTDDPYYNDTEYEAEVTFMTIRDLRKLSNGKLTEEQLFKIAQLSADRHGNGTWRFGSSFLANNASTLNFSFDDYRVEVLDFSYYTTDIFKYEERTRPDGRTYFSKKSLDYKAPEKSKYNIDITEKHSEQCYTGLWVVGTEYLAKYGRDKNITRPNKDGKMSSKLLKKYIIIEPNRRNGTSKSMIDQIKPKIDEIQLLTLKMRHFIAEAVPPGLAIDWNSLNNMNVDGQGNWKPLDLIRLYKQKGIIIFDRTDDNGEYTNGKSVEFLQNGIQDGLRPFMEAINFQLTQIASITGINEARDGSKPDKDALVGIQKLALIASNNATRELYEGYTKGLFERSGLLVSRMVQDKIHFTGGIGQYISVIGKNGVMSLEFIPKDIVLAELGIKTEAIPTGAELQELTIALNAAVQSGEIRYEDSIEIKGLNNPKKAVKYLKHRKKKYQEEAMQEMAQKEQMTMQREQAAVQASMQKEQAILAAKAEAEKAVLVVEYAEKTKYMIAEYVEKTKLQQWGTYGKIQEIEKAAETDLDDTKSSNSQNPQPKVFPSVK